MMPEKGRGKECKKALDDGLGLVTYEEVLQGIRELYKLRLL